MRDGPYGPEAQLTNLRALGGDVQGPAPGPARHVGPKLMRRLFDATAAFAILDADGNNIGTTIDVVFVRARPSPIVEVTSAQGASGPADGMRELYARFLPAIRGAFERLRHDGEPCERLSFSVAMPRTPPDPVRRADAEAVVRLFQMRKPKRVRYADEGDACHPRLLDRLLDLHDSTCWICNARIPRAGEVPEDHPLFPSVDHVPGRVTGVESSTRNTLPAHRICNILRSVPRPPQASTCARWQQRHEVDLAALWERARRRTETLGLDVAQRTALECST